MKAGILAAVAVLCFSAASFAADPAPYTFGMTVVAPVMKAPKMYIPALAGASGNLLTISTGSTNVFTVTAAGVATAKSFVGPVSATTLGISGLVSGSSASFTGSVAALTFSGNGAAVTGVIASSVAANGVRPGSVVAGAIVNADVNASAAIALSKLGTAGTVTADAVNISGSGQLLIGNATSAELELLVPGQAKGALIFNSDTDNLCASTATAVGSWVIVSTPTLACY